MIDRCRQRRWGWVRDAVDVVDLMQSRTNGFGRRLWATLTTLGAGPSRTPTSGYSTRYQN